MKLQFVLFVVAVSWWPAFAAKLPSDFETCKDSEWPKLDECLKSASQKAVSRLKNGLPELHFAPLEPLLVESATIGAGTGPVDIVQNYKNMNVYGLSQAKITDFKFKLADDKKSAELTIDAVTPEFGFEGQYSVNGKLLLLPVVGDGPCKISTTNMKFHMVMKADIYEKKGKDYMKVTEVKSTLDPDHVTYRFDNLFNGDKTLGDQINNVLNDNWKDIFLDIRSGYENLLSTVLTSYTNSIFSKVPCEELLPWKK